jgi:hypothetical protein
VAAADKEAVDKRVVEEAATKWVVEERATEEATAKAAAAEAVGAAGGSPAPGQALSTTGAKWAVAPSGSTPPAKRPYRGVWKPQFVQLSPPFFLFSFFYYPFLSRSSPSSVAAVTGAAAADAVIGAALGPALINEPRTPEGVPKDVVESEGEPKVAPEAVPEVVQEEAPTEGAMITVRMTTAPSPSRGARAPLLSVPRRAAASGAAAKREWRWSWGIPPLTRWVTSP